METPKHKTVREGNKVIFTRILQAPKSLVWEVWTKPEHITHWWGPEQFSIENKSMEVKPGGKWTFDMKGMGMLFAEDITYIEVIPQEKLVFQNGQIGVDPYAFESHILFESLDNGLTMLTMITHFSSSAILDELNEKVKALEGGNQTLNKLETYLSSL